MADHNSTPFDFSEWLRKVAAEAKSQAQAKQVAEFARTRRLVVEFVRSLFAIQPPATGDDLWDLVEAAEILSDQILRTTDEPPPPEVFHMFVGWLIARDPEAARAFTKSGRA